MNIGRLAITFHRTVRVSLGDKPAALPPSLGYMEEFRVRDWQGRCPAGWAADGIVLGLHETEAMWMSLAVHGAAHGRRTPLAVMVGAGGVNALTGQKLGTALVKDGYLVTPPQPWLDGWKAPDGTVYQFVATRYQGGQGQSVGEQLLGAASQTGGIGISVFEPKDPAKLAPYAEPLTGWGDDPYGQPAYWPKYGLTGQSMMASSASYRVEERTRGFGEMGVGRGGKIAQKVYADPHGLDAWQPTPVTWGAIYLVDAQAYQEITGRPLPPPVDQGQYKGKWFGVADKTHQDVPGTGKFDAVKPAVPAEPPKEVFPG